MARKTARKKGIRIEIPGFGDREVRTVVVDYTGTLSYRGELVDGVKERIVQLSKLVDVHVISADSTCTAKKHLGDLPLTLHILKAEHQDCAKREYVLALAPEYIAAFGNGNNDRLFLRAVKERAGLAIAVDNGEGCAVDAIVSSHVFIHGAVNALDLLLDVGHLVATLHF